MKKQLFPLITPVILVALSLASCDIVEFNKGARSASAGDGLPEAVSFALDPSCGFEADARTRAAATTAIASFRAAATTGSAGSESSAWNNVTFTTDGASTPTYTGGKYWPNENPSYHFYAVTVSEGAASAPDLSFAAGGTTLTADGSKDVVCAYFPYAAGSYKSKNALAFRHIYARLSTVKVNAHAAYAISNVTVSLVNVKTGGTYNLRTGSGQTDGTGWSALTPASPGDTQIYANSGTIAAGGNHTGADNDLYLVPGTYSVKATWTASKDDYTQTFTAITSSAPVSIVGGQINTIECLLTGSATELQFSVSLAPWGANAINLGTYPLENS